MAIKLLDKEGEPNHRFTYNGKEFEEETGYLDYHARQMDSQLGRFMSVDPHAENYYNTSPYTYVMNNSVNMIDPDGKDGIAVVDHENKSITVKATVFITGKNVSKELAESYTKDVGEILKSGSYTFITDVTH